jgi:hypothetical protein
MVDWERKLPALKRSKNDIDIVYCFMRPILTFILLLVLECSFAQNFSYPSIWQSGSSITDFVPSSWTIIDSALGDLNKDNLIDYAVVLQHADSVTISKTEDDIVDTVLTQPRMLLILFKSSNNSLYLAEQNNSFILNHDNPDMEDPYQFCKIDKGILQIAFRLFYNMGSWYVNNATYKFRYQNNQFALIGAEYRSFHRASQDFEEYSYNFLAGKRSLTSGNEEKRTKKTEWKTLKIFPLQTLKTFHQPFTWEVEDDMYL